MSILDEQREVWGSTRPKWGTVRQSKIIAERQTNLRDLGLITGRTMRIGEVLRYPLIARNLDLIVDQERLGGSCGHRNFYWVTKSPPAAMAPARLEKGIWPIASVTGPDGGLRKPAVLIRISSHKAGSAETPWHDDVDQIAGDATYYGDKRADDKFTRPDESPGNRILLEQQAFHHSPQREGRLTAAPLLFFSGVAQEGSPKGHVRFDGVAVMRRVTLVSQIDSSGNYFSNYRFDCSLISLAEEGEWLPWDWISARRRKDLTAEEALVAAPAAWREWVDDGMDAIPKVRRRVALATTLSAADQLPTPGSADDQTLAKVLEFYATRKHRFEALAARIMQVRLENAGHYVQGWLTRSSGDGGFDMVARLDLGSGLHAVPVVVLGQAKCTDRGPASAMQLARLVARLRRGWIGAFVTTGFFTRGAQVELRSDEYPVLLIAGRQVAQTVSRLAVEEAEGSVDHLLRQVDAAYDAMVTDMEASRVLRLG